MRKLSFVAALAVSLAGAQAAHAQAPRDSAAHKWNGREGRGGPAMMQHALLKDITLSDAQKAQLEKLERSERSSMTADSGARRAEFDAMRKARQSGDTVAAHRLMLEQRTKMDERFTAHTAAIRAILTPDQQKQLDANVAEVKAHRSEFGRGREPGHEHAKRSPTS